MKGTENRSMVVKGWRFGKVSTVNRNRNFGRMMELFYIMIKLVANMCTFVKLTKLFTKKDQCLLYLHVS